MLIMPNRIRSTIRREPLTRTLHAAADEIAGLPQYPYATVFMPFDERLHNIVILITVLIRCYSAVATSIRFRTGQPFMCMCR